MSNYINKYYNHSFSFQLRAKEIIKNLVLNSSETILDIGCGDGRITSIIASLVPQGKVIGIDISPEILDFARSKFPNSEYPNLNFQYGDISNLEIENTFDVVLSIGCLHYIKNQSQVLKNIHKALKLGGIAVLHFQGNKQFNHINFFIKILDLILEREDYKPLRKILDYGFYSPEEYQLFLENEGFKIKTLAIKTYYYTYQNKEDLKENIRTQWLSITNRIPENICENFIEDFADIFWELNLLDGQDFIEEEYWLEVEAIKL